MASFFGFCFGTFAIGLAHFAAASWTRQMSEAWIDDMNAWGRNETTITAMDARHRALRCSWKAGVFRWGVRASFVALMLGGILAAVPFLRTLW